MYLPQTEFHMHSSSSSVPVRGYYYIPVISLDPKRQLLIFPYTFHSPLHTISLLRSHSLSASHCKSATTDASHKPLTPNPRHAPIFGAKNEADKLEMVSDDCSVESQLESQCSIWVCPLWWSTFSKQRCDCGFPFFASRRAKLPLTKLPWGALEPGTITYSSCKYCH